MDHRADCILNAMPTRELLDGYIHGYEDNYVLRCGEKEKVENGNYQN